MRNAIADATLALEGIVVLAASVTEDQTELVVESRHDAGCCPMCGRADPEPSQTPGPIARTYREKNRFFADE